MSISEPSEFNSTMLIDQKNRLRAWTFILRFFPLACLVLGISSCGSQPDGPQRFAASGTVTVDGKAAPYGEIMFRPDTAKGNSGPGAFAQIEDGKYATLKDKGPTIGPYIADVTILDGVPTEDSPQGLPMLKDRYSVEIVVPNEAFTHDFQVPAELLLKK